MGAGVLLAHAAPAQADVEVTLGGYTEFGAQAATDETLQDDPDRGYTFFMDNEVHIEATGTSDTGLTYGSYAAIELASDDANDANAFVDEINLFFSGGFGRIELGRQDGAEDEMFVGAEDAQSGTGGIDGDAANLGSIINVQNSDNATKATYYTPRIGGFQLGASYLPDTGDDGGRDGAGFDAAFGKALGGGVNWVGGFGAAEVTLSAVAVYGRSEDPGADDLEDYSVGGLIAAGDLALGATWGQLTEANAGNWASLGLQYSFGQASASVGYSWVDDHALGDEQNVFVVSGDLGLAPGLTLLADVSYNSDDPSAGGEDDTLAGVISIQLDY